jgi:hypothetical protein
MKTSLLTAMPSACLHAPCTPLLARFLAACASQVLITEKLLQAYAELLPRCLPEVHKGLSAVRSCLNLWCRADC